ncbi:DUF5050 domain-containing protein [Alkalibacterium sp. f15]|uniref:DUF5050 domain-containing protein n=1 Tax=Alkalibacterium sp. f15 TaxID=3414029 RepID=UPI003BF825ED
MKTLKNWLYIALRGTVFVYLPVALLLYGSYRAVFNINPGVQWAFIVFYLLFFLRWLIAKYRHQSIEEEVQSFDGLDKLIEQGRWKVTDKSENEMTVRPTFDVPLNRVVNDRIVLHYVTDKVTIEGPKHYITILDKNIRGEESLWTRKSVSSLKFILIAVIGLMPLMAESNLVWSMNVLRHNTLSSVSDEVEIDSEEYSGNSLENTLNYGRAVESEKYIFYVENHLNLVKIDKQFENKEYLIEQEGGTGVSQLNVVGDWLYFTRGESLERMRTDGSAHSTLYSLGYLVELQIQGNWIYFLSWEDDFSVYKMDLNGQNLEQLIDVKASSLSIYDSRLLISHEKEGRSVVESYSLDGRDGQVVINDPAQNLTIWNDDYYYIGGNHKLYRSEVGEESEPEVVVHGPVSSYLPTEQGIIYSLHSSQGAYPGAGVYKMTFDGSESSNLSDLDRVEGFAKVGDSVLFTAGVGFDEPDVNRIDLESESIDVLD